MRVQRQSDHSTFFSPKYCSSEENTKTTHQMKESYEFPSVEHNNESFEYFNHPYPRKL